MVENLEAIPAIKHKMSWCEDDLVLYNDGQAWTSVIIDGEARHVHLGRESDVRAILKGEKPISDKCSYTRQMALARILQIKEEIHGGETYREGMVGSGVDGISRSKQKNTRLPANRKRATGRNAHKARTRVFRR